MTTLECAYNLRNLLISYHATKNERFKRSLEDCCQDLWQVGRVETQDNLINVLSMVWRDKKLKVVTRHLLTRLQETAETGQELQNILEAADMMVEVYRVEQALSYFVRNLHDLEMDWTECVNRLCQHEILFTR